MPLDDAELIWIWDKTGQRPYPYGGCTRCLCELYTRADFETHWCGEAR